MKMFRPALAGILPAFVLLLCIQLNAHAASIPPRPPEMQSSLGGDDHVWLPVGMLPNRPTFATARASDGFSLRQLAFQDRVAYQRAIEEVYWRHRIWPKERPDRKPSLDTAMSQAAIKQKVQDYLRESESLEEEWQQPITPEQLQAEMERMAQHTKAPEVLHELFAALDNDPFVIAECLARPVLLERLQLAAVEGQEPLESWSATVQNQVPNVMSATNANYTLPAIPDQPSECIDNWIDTSTINAPRGRESYTAVWTGSEMIVWGGYNLRHWKTGGRYNPSTDSWAATSTANAPIARFRHTAVWTGSEMIVWGGSDFSNYFNTGGRYNPDTDSWTATSTVKAPMGRQYHTAVWTGSEMIVWGGYSFDGAGHYLNTGGKYNPDTDTWTATNTANAPVGRVAHTAVLSGEMIVWGGYFFDGDSHYLNTGGKYNPNADSWTATTTIDAPTARQLHTAVSTGSEMIVWGGGDCCMVLNTGGRYNPGTDSWTATTAANAPTERTGHTAVWTGSEMIVWGGIDRTGGRYNPGTDSWTATSNSNPPSARAGHTAVWTGSEMVVWGGFDQSTDYLKTGGRYCAQIVGPFTLSAERRKVGGINTVRLIWSGATSTQIDVYRDGNRRPLARTVNDGAYIDSTGDSGRAHYIYWVCEAGTSTCSNSAGARFPQ